MEIFCGFLGTGFFRTKTPRNISPTYLYQEFNASLHPPISPSCRPPSILLFHEEPFLQYTLPPNFLHPQKSHSCPCIQRWVWGFFGGVRLPPGYRHLMRPLPPSLFSGIASFPRCSILFAPSFRLLARSFRSLFHGSLKTLPPRLFLFVGPSVTPPPSFLLKRARCRRKVIAFPWFRYLCSLFIPPLMAAQTLFPVSPSPPGPSHSIENNCARRSFFLPDPLFIIARPTSPFSFIRKAAKKQHLSYPWGLFSSCFLGLPRRSRRQASLHTMK